MDFIPCHNKTFLASIRNLQKDYKRMIKSGYVNPYGRDLIAIVDYIHKTKKLYLKDVPFLLGAVNLSEEGKKNVEDLIERCDNDKEREELIIIQKERSYIENYINAGFGFNKTNFSDFKLETSEDMLQES